MSRAASWAPQPLLVIGLVLCTSGSVVRARAPSRPPPPPFPPPPPTAAVAQVSGYRGARSLQGLLGFLHGFRLGHGLAVGLHAHSALYDLLLPVWYPPGLAAAPAQPANQQQIVNLLAANDVGENYQEMNGHNRQVISNAAEYGLLSLNDSHRTSGYIKSDVNDSFGRTDSNQLAGTHKSKLKIREAQDNNASLAVDQNIPVKSEQCETKLDCTNKDPIGNDMSSTEVTTAIIETTPFDFTTTETENSTDPEHTTEPEEATTPIVGVTYPNRSNVYPDRTFGSDSIDDISITTDISASFPTETETLAADRTYLHTLALPLEDNDWEHFSREKLGDSGFRPLVGGYSYYNYYNMANDNFIATSYA